MTSSVKRFSTPHCYAKRVSYEYPPLKRVYGQAITFNKCVSDCLCCKNKVIIDYNKLYQEFMEFKCAECGLESNNLSFKTFPKSTDDYDFSKVSNVKNNNKKQLKVFINCERCTDKLEIDHMSHYSKGDIREMDKFLDDCEYVLYTFSNNTTARVKRITGNDIHKYRASCKECMIDHYYYGIHIDSFPKSFIGYC